jgi:hypothetical protein
VELKGTNHFRYTLVTLNFVESINTIQRNTNGILDSHKVAGPEGNQDQYVSRGQYDIMKATN